MNSKENINIRPKTYIVGAANTEDDSRPILRPQSRLIRETQMTRRRRAEMSQVTSVALMSDRITREKVEELDGHSKDDK